MQFTQFESVLEQLCTQLTAVCGQGPIFKDAKSFENSVRQTLVNMLRDSGITADPTQHPYSFPDIVIGNIGVEVKYTANDTWRSVANSIFETFRKKSVETIYVVFGKMGGSPSVRWARYDESIIHVRTSHVPRFELDIDAKESLFNKLGITYADFSTLPEHQRMHYVREYARNRLKPGERLWWLEEAPDAGHSLPLEVKLFANLTHDEKLRMRAEASLLCPQIVGSSRNKAKYHDPIIFLLTYHGVLATRDAFSAGSAAGPERGGNYVQKALARIQPQMMLAAQYMDPSLFAEYWGHNVPPEQRITEWLQMADHYASLSTPPWKPSDSLFTDSRP